MSLLQSASNRHLMMFKKKSQFWVDWPTWCGLDTNGHHAKDGKEEMDSSSVHCTASAGSPSSSQIQHGFPKYRQIKQIAFLYVRGRAYMRRELSIMTCIWHGPKDRSHLKSHHPQVNFLLSNFDGLLLFLVSLEKMKSQWAMGTEG